MKPHRMAAGLFVAFVIFAGGSAPGCGGKGGSGHQTDAQLYCEEDTDCPLGQRCAQNVCAPVPDASVDSGPPPAPQIVVEPESLDFGFAPLRTDTVLPLTIRNVGTADLELSALLVEEVDGRQEFHANPEGVQSPALVIPPGQSIQVEVTLRPEDAELDTGNLRINCNDPDRSIVIVPLTSGYKGIPDLETCALDATALDPEPFVDCAEHPIDHTPVIDFGVVMYQQDESRLVVARNIADGNAPLSIDTITITDTSGLAFHYGLELFWLEEDPGTGDTTEIPVTLPVYLRAADPVQALEEDHLYIRVSFDADLDGFLPEEDLVITTGEDGSVAIPISGVVSGCPEGTWDLNGDPNDGCEYLCDYTGPEVCDGADNDCDGLTDEQDALGCTVYYRDVDNDAFGVTADARCLCQPDLATHHRALQGGDCDDSRNTVNPGELEQCNTAADDDCDGDTNDLDAFGCTVFYEDGDADTWGQAGSSACHCLPVGQFTATRSGDCDDTNPNAHPNAAEDCNTPYDDDCSGSTNDDDALHCIDHYVDLDGDTYGQTSLSRCLCVPSGNYTAIQPGDCNDNSAAVHPGATEDCSTPYDDNCDMNPNEEGALNCTSYYRDQDSDGHGVTSDVQCRCAPLNEYRATLSGDCNDANPAVNPAALENCSTAYDDNCDGATNDINSIGCATFYRDDDGDTFGVTTDNQCRCHGEGAYTAAAPGDCADGDPLVHPAAQENCSTAHDDNCNGFTDELNAANCTSYYFDGDGDGYGVTSNVECRCAPRASYTAVLAGECNDSAPAIHPGATEICDGVDNNCQSGIDEGFDLQSDLAHCGSCNTACTNAHGATACVGGLCAPSCDAGWGNCNGNRNDGCETDLATVTFCGTCTVVTDCPPDFFCDAGLCRAEKTDGQPCADDEECSSGHCTDGYCCDTACDTTCEACDLSGSRGTCSAVAAGQDPDDECAADTQSTCGQSGACDGSRGCALWATGTQCQAASCSGSTRYLADTCDGNGVCTDQGTQSCSPYVCSGADCRTDCADQSHCVAGSYCNAGACSPKKTNGDTCGVGLECVSGNCVDGVCCDTPCTGTCRSCGLATSLGTCANRPGGTDPENECGPCRQCTGTGACAPVAAGVDPKSDCAAQAETSCGLDGECDGAGGCRQWASGTQCQPQNCIGHVKSLRDDCNGAGTCVDSGSVDCSPYNCNGTGTDCLTSCTLSTECVSGSFCSGGTCAGQKGNGQSCGGNAECLSDFCVDGVCCNAACSGTCRHCNLTGSVGTCTNIPTNQDPDAECAGTCQACNGVGACGNTAAGVDPEGECATQAASSCGTDGECNGAGACRQWVAGTQCVAQSCTGETKLLADTCDGSGTCSDSGSVGCAPYICNATGTDCRTDCSLDTHCTTGNFCSGGLCASKKTLGDPCTAGNQCTSGICADGVCCNQACSGACRACNLAGSEGTCTSHTAGTDPEVGCGLCRACDGAGLCAAAADGSDPKNECAQQSISSCGLDGACDGAGACGLWPTGSVCAPQSCTGSTRYNADLCDGAGGCIDQGTTSCAPYLCVGDACGATCAADTDCVAGSYCAGGACMSKKPLGQVCGAANECSSGFCADGLCCNTDCAGTCRSCNKAGALGTCTPHTLATDPEVECGLCQACNGSGACTAATAGTDPKSECAPTGTDTCGLDGQCNGAGACRFWASGTVCQVASCTGFTRYLPDLCDGAGTCGDGGTQSCSPYACVGAVCGTSCAVHTDCASGNYCTVSGTCVSKKVNGQSCSATAECDSGFCVDGVCCNGACTGTCQGCNVAGAVGTCTNHAAQTDPETECGICRTCSGSGSCLAATGGTDPKNDCTQADVSTCGLDGACTGTGACRYWTSGTECVTQTCTNHVKYRADTCNGSGTCLDNGTVDCTPYQCGGNDCLSSCSNDANCVSGYYCSGGACLAKKPTGQLCGAANECATGFCADGVCCDGACTGDCRACNQSGSVGTCTYYATATDPEGNCGLCRVCNGAGTCVAAADGTDPKSQCTADSQDSCDQDGWCNGSGACRLWASGTQCAAPICGGNTLQRPDTCNGTGTCTDGGSQDCTPYLCDGTGTACRTTCSVTAHCVAGFHCDTGVCVPNSPVGTACVLDGECGTGLCRDGYCCNNDCSGSCRACNLPGVEGTCSNYPATTDPQNECGTCRVCNGSGACIPATNDTDPKGECNADPQSSCGLDGACDGSGACGYYPSGTVCTAQSCTGSTKYLADTCSGSGACVDNATQSCAPYLCAGTDCATTCSTDGDCVAGYYCAAGACLPKKGNGQTCGAGTECVSGSCADGVCCNTACAGACRACDLAGNVGTCTNIPSNTDPDTECPTCQACNGSGACGSATDGTDPKNECDGSASSTCGPDGSCDGAGNCGYWPSSTVCAVQSCTGSTLYYTDYCTGGGTCTDGGTTSCAPYVCNGDACRTTCTDNSHCIGGYECKSGQCKSWVQILFEDFEPCPGNWVREYINNEPWYCTTTDNTTNAPSGGQYAEIDSDDAGFVDVDTRLITPALNFSGYTEVWLSFWHDYYDFSVDDFGYVEVSTNGGATWTVIRTYDSDIRGVFEDIDVSSWVVGQTNVKFAFHYVGNYDWWWRLDDVAIDAI